MLNHHWNLANRASAATLVLIVCCLLPTAVVHGDDADGVRFFETHIRPVLVKQCYSCHAESVQAKGGLRLDTKAGLLTGGSSGPSVVPKYPEESLLIASLKHEGPNMPPAGKLPDEVISKFEEWVAMGAPDPRDSKPAEILGRREIDLEAGRAHWAFQPLARVEPASTSRVDWAWTRVDRYLLAKMEQAGVAPSADARPEIWLRRVTFALTGLPPTPSELASIEQDFSPAARERIVDQLLASPRYGERWARHWFDVARYAESTGKERNFLYHQAWRYRDYVIDAFNADKPYDQFLREQIAGDLLPAENDKVRDEQRIATGFLALGPKGLNERNREAYLLDIVDEQIDSLGRAILGTSIGCARCHDHKFDPIPTQDYYAFAGILRSTEVLSGVMSRQRFSGDPEQLMALSAATSGNDATVVAAEITSLKGLEKEWEATRDEVRKLRQMNRKKAAAATLAPAEMAEKPASTPATTAAPVETPAPAVSSGAATARTPDGATAPATPATSDSAANPSATAAPVSTPAVEAEPDRLKVREKDLADLDRRISEKRDALSSVLVKTYALGVRDRAEPVDLAVRVRGEVDKLGPVVERGFLSVLKQDWTPSIESAGSGRLTLASWITDARHPLTARVYVNRVWQKLLAQGIVPTVDDFGTQGQAPTHKELLDDLAARFIEQGWSTKTLIREIVLSHVFAVQFDPESEAAKIDGENKLYWRWNRHRLEAEAIRDALLFSTDSLDVNRPVGQIADGIGTREIRGQTDLSALQKDYSFRSVYLPFLRNQTPQVLALFDVADPSLITGQRDETTSPNQALFFMNSDTVSKQAVALATTVNNPELAETERIELAFIKVLGRRPSSGERDAVSRFLGEFEAARAASGLSQPAARESAWAAFAQTLLASPEFRYVF